MINKTRSANYHKRNCIIPKGFENYYKKNREFSDDGVEIIKTELEKTDFQKTFLYKLIEKESRNFYIHAKESKLIATSDLIYFTGGKEKIQNNKVISVLNRFNSYKSEFFNFTICKDLKNFVNMMQKIQKSSYILTQMIDFVIFENNLTIICKNEKAGLESEFYLKTDQKLNITYTFDLEYISKAINNSSINDNVEIEITKDKFVIFKNLTQDFSIIFTKTETITPKYENKTESKTVEIPKIIKEIEIVKIPKVETNQNQIILREKFELKILEIPTNYFPQIIKKDYQKSNNNFYILVEYFENDCKKYSLFIDKFFTTRENAKNQIKQSRESKNALAISLQIVSEKILNEKLKNKKTNQTINYLWQTN